MAHRFEADRPILDRQYEDIRWQTGSGLEPHALEEEISALEAASAGLSRSMIKALTFETLCRHGQIAVLPEDIFQEKLNARGIMNRQRDQWWREVSVHFRDEAREIARAAAAQAYTANPDFGHTIPDTGSLTKLGFAGLAERLTRAEAAIPSPTEGQRDFYASSRIALGAMADFCLRLSRADGVSRENAAALRQLSTGAPRTMYEAMQQMIVYFYLHEYVAGTRVRSLGRLDEVFLPFYAHDLQSGLLTREDALELWKYFLGKFSAMNVPYGLPFCIGGVGSIGRDGAELTNDLSYLIVEAYDSLNVYSPKIQVRVSPKTPPDFVKTVLRCIRGGNSSFVFVNDAVCLKAMAKCGVPEEDAVRYVPVGCYEPGIVDLELPCTGNGWVSLPKAVEFAFTRGRDHRTGEQIGADTGEITSYAEFKDAVKRQIAFMVDHALRYIAEIEQYYMDAGPDPILSAMMSPCVEKGTDAFAGGAKYNNSSLYMHSIATLADSVAAVRKIVFDEGRMSFEELGEILKADWQGHEKLRLEMLSDPEKYGNNTDSVDSIAAEFAAYTAGLINGRPNGRGGFFKAANFTIDTCFANGKGTMATPDGRKSGDPNSKNLCAATAMDRKGITALIHSVTKMDHSDFPNGSVLDFMLHPSAVAGEEGLDAFYAVLTTYFAKGGFALHGNVFDAEELKKARKEPEKYANLQVRVCGWNARFVTLSEAEQDAFIRQAENAS